MIDIFLGHAYFLKYDVVERRVMKPYPPLGILYLSAYLKRAGFSVEVFDATFRDHLARRRSTCAGTSKIGASLRFGMSWDIGDRSRTSIEEVVGHRTVEIRFDRGCAGTW